MQKVKVGGQRSMWQRSKQILPQFGRFRTVTLVLNSQMVMKWFTKWHRGGVPSFFKVIRQISRSHGPKKNRRFWPELSVSRLLSQLIRRWLLLSRSPDKFQSHTDWKLNLDLIWVRLLSRSQLPDPPALHCSSFKWGILIRESCDFAYEITQIWYLRACL